MAGERIYRHVAAACGLYQTARNTAGQYAKGGGLFEALVVANWAANYIQSLTETPASSYLYVGDFSGYTAQLIFLETYEKPSTGSTATIGDVLVDADWYWWSGTAFVPSERAVQGVPAAPPGGAGGLALYNDPMTLTAAERNAVADAALSRAVSNVEGTADKHSLAYVILVLSEASTASGALVVNQSDGVTVFTTKTATFDANARPITGIS